MNIAGYIDHTILKPTTTLAEVEKLCGEAVKYGFAAVCVPPSFVKRADAILDPTDVKVATVVGFPFGYSATEAKLAETVLALVDGADEIDVVINLIALRMNDWDFLVKEVKLLAEVIHNKGKVFKLIVESGILSDNEIIECCEKLGGAGIDFMKTSTGYAEKGATVEAVQLMRKHLPSNIKIKASGGIRDFEFAKKLVDAGADRLGCSASVAIATGDPSFDTKGY
ncbi:deoxyribose-phosphate aldolase [Pinibacter aurantiacus]|uniref:Deoxyribose-phosphate aldolase n=1 Tax=Pinibacter aurantiacus TaxID=2851599 RepID=A0A9E2S6P0_9BACT|nr:deoxyribose-phosphate aldolase [Pinibacter aurantiacus]MBV4357096.1 deoxyribose-phosphate aldolase [Pinibacter aurantiacus]MDH7462256.1 deoxyribose-phosphate aldolase [Chitinophagaceae bacterium 26-R-25]